MAIKLGNNDISFKVGNSDVDAIYLGSTLVYSGGTPPTPTFQGKWLATYADSHTESAECDSSSAITRNEINGTNLVSVEIGDCVTSIGYRAFYQCTGLTSCTIGDSVTSIGASAFRNCTSLTSIDIPDGVTSIGNDAFSNCSGLTSIDIPDSVTSIGNNAFQNCSGLTSIDIPSGVTSIGDEAFYRCSGLTSITVNATTPPTLGNDAFDNTNNCPIYVPSASVNAYQSDWSDYASRIQAIPASWHTISSGSTISTLRGSKIRVPSSLTGNEGDNVAFGTTSNNVYSLVYVPFMGGWCNWQTWTNGSSTIGTISAITPVDGYYEIDFGEDLDGFGSYTDTSATTTTDTAPFEFELYY